MASVKLGTAAVAGILLFGLLDCGKPMSPPGRMADKPMDAAQTMDTNAANQGGATMAKATFAAGCFWGVEDAFLHVKGVTSTQVGYSGGHTQNPTYEEVCSHSTGHAEAVEVTYDPQVVTYKQLLDVFWDSHDPTQLNRQGPDVGDNYRSVIFYHTPGQKAAAEASQKALEASGKCKQPIVTQIVPAGKFWRAEEYHQHYVQKHGGAGCQIRL